MKELKYNNQTRLLISGEMLAVINSPLKMLKKDVLHTNRGRLFRNLLVKKMEEVYSKPWLEKTFKWSSIPEVQEYRFAEAGGYEAKTRHYRDKIKNRLDEYYEKRRKGEDTSDYDDLNQVKFDFDNTD